jgi:hypothetical protein
MNITKEIETSRRRRYDKSMADLNQEIVAYEKMQNSLEVKHTGKWVVIHDGTLIAVYDFFEAAANDAVEKFGRGPFLIRQVGAPPMTLPASVMYNPDHGPDEMRIQ